MHSPNCTWANYFAELSSLAFSLGGDFLLGLPSGLGTKTSTSDRRTNFLPATSTLWSRPSWTSWRIRSWDTPLIRAASACEIQSLRSSPLPNFTIEVFKSFLLQFCELWSRFNYKP
jgi:hypothetical protein